MLKTLRDIRETIGSFISIIAVILIGCFFLAGITAGSTAVTLQVSDYYDSCNYASYRAEYMLVNAPAVEDIAAQKGVKKAAGYNSFYVTARHNGAVDFDMSISTLTEGIDDPHLLSGRLPEKGNDELIIDTVTAEAHGVGIGDKLAFDLDVLQKITLSSNTQGTGGQAPQYATETTPRAFEFTVCGIFHSPDVIYKVDTHNTAALPDEFILAYVDGDALPLYTEDATVEMAGMTLLRYKDVPVKLYNGVRVLTDGDIDTDEVFGRYLRADSDKTGDMLFAEVQAMLADLYKPAGFYMYSMERDSFPAVQAFDGLNDTIAALAAVLPLIFFAVAAAITVISMSKTVDNQRMQIGVIQAIGVSKGAVYFSYIFYALLASVIGGTAGGLIGLYTVPMLINFLYARQFSMPPTAQTVSPAFLLVGIAVAAALACLAAFLSCHHTLRVKPAQAMRPKPPKKTKRILAERWKWLWSKLGFGAKMNMRNMFLHKVRMLLSSVGIIGCLSLLIALLGLKDNMARSFDMYEATVGYDLTVVATSPVDIESFDIGSLAERDGAEYIERLTFVPDFSGRFTHGGNTADMTVMALPSSADAQKYDYADADCVKMFTDRHGRNRLEIKENTFAVPTQLADKLEVDVGDTVHISGYSRDGRSIDIDAVITDIIYEYFEQKVYTSYDYFENKGVGLYALTSYAKLKPSASKDKAVEVLTAYSELRDVRAFSDSFDALQDKMSMLDYAAILFAVGAAILAVAVIYNITSTNLKERTREIATLMVLGYKPRETANMLIVENMVITAIGCIIGLPLGFGLMLWLVKICSNFNVLISAFLNWYIVIGCIALTFAFSLIATLMFNLKIKKISMVEALKSVE